jgi:hypothetical protein
MTVRECGEAGYENRSESKLPDDEQEPHARPTEWEELAQASSERRARQFQFYCHSALEVNEAFGQWRIVFLPGEWEQRGLRRPTGSPKGERSESNLIDMRSRQRGSASVSNGGCDR